MLLHSTSLFQRSLQGRSLEPNTEIYKSGGSVSVAAKVRRVQSLAEVLGFPSPAKMQLQTSQTMCRSLFKKAKQEQHRTHEKAEGISWEQRKNSKDVDHEEIGDNG